MKPTSTEIKTMAEQFLHEMEIYPGLEVCLTPAPDPKHSGHGVRTVCSQNPPWYRKFAAKYENCRGTGHKRMKRPRTYIVRSFVPPALQKIVDGNPSGVYCERLLEFIGTELSKTKTDGTETKFDWLITGRFDEGD